MREEHTKKKNNQAYTHTNLARTHTKNKWWTRRKDEKKIIIIWNMTKCAYKWNKSKSLQEIRYYGLKCSDNYLAIIMNNWMAIHVIFHSIMSWHTLHFEKKKHEIIEQILWINLFLNAFYHLCSDDKPHFVVFLFKKKDERYILLP